MYRAETALLLLFTAGEMELSFTPEQASAEWPTGLYTSIRSVKAGKCSVDSFRRQVSSGSLRWPSAQLCLLGEGYFLRDGYEGFAERCELVLTMLLSTRKAHRCNLSLPPCPLPVCRACRLHTKGIYMLRVVFKCRQRKSSHLLRAFGEPACIDLQNTVWPHFRRPGWSCSAPSFPSRVFHKWRTHASVFAFWMTAEKHLKRAGFSERAEHLRSGSHPILAVWSWNT